MSSKHTRNIKLQPKHRSSKIVPELRINGLWLKDAGFEAGKMVQIITGINELIIKAL